MEIIANQKQYIKIPTKKQVKEAAVKLAIDVKNGIVDEAIDFKLSVN
jgi:hypothetical protein